VKAAVAFFAGASSAALVALAGAVFTASFFYFLFNLAAS
jgi:hypothetical protein